MNPYREKLVEMGRQWIEHAPPAVSPPTDLLGWSGAVGFVCVTCAGRIIGRGCNLKQLADVPMWRPAIAPNCNLCYGGGM